MIQLSKRLIAIVFVLFWSFSCTDHEFAENDPAKIKTLELKHSVNPTFFVQFESLGNIPITEYGIAMSTGVAGYLVGTPMIADEIVVFTSPPNNLDVKSQVYNKLFADANYRAYAKLSNGTVVYGEVLKFRFQPL